MSDVTADPIAPPGLPADWPHRAHSRLHEVGRIGWHVQHWPGPAASAGATERVLLLHGTGASAHSWHALAPGLAEKAEVLAPDLPGHGFTRTPDDQPLSLDGVSRALRDLLLHLAWKPTRVVAHSAGAAIACRLSLDSMISPALVVAINGALLPLQGPVGRLFTPIARLLSAQPVVPAAFSGWATLPGSTRRMLEGTGSRIDAVAERCYRQLLMDPRHVAGALRLMASWDLEPLRRELPRLAPPLRLIVGLADRTLSPAHARRVQALLPSAQCIELPGLGHLAHEEDAATVAPLCLMPAPPRGRAAAGALAGRVREAAQAPVLTGQRDVESVR